MSNHLKFFIDGVWVDPVVPAVLDVIDPSTEEAYTQISVGSKADVDKAVAAAKTAFASFSLWSVAERLALLKKVLEVYNERFEDIAQAVSQEMGAPLSFAREAQAWAGRAHMESTIAALETYEFSEKRGSTTVVKEPIGVCALITPWNWPLNQIVCKVAPAIAAGCTVVLKPSEIAPISGVVFSEVMEAAGVPKGVYNMVQGNGPDVGQVMAGHPDVDMVSFTGSTRAGIIVAKTAADTVKRVAQELGGKSANIILPDADFETAVRKGVQGCFGNSGQSCDAPTRMLVPADRHDEALGYAKSEAETFVVGDPRSEETVLGPVVSQLQFDKIQRLIEAGIKEGATLVAGGLGRPENLNRGYYVRPTVFGNVTNDMTIAREEIFGPVLSILPYKDEEEAVTIANDTVYGLAAYVQSQDIAHARKVAARMRAGSVYLNYPEWDTFAPFGGYKQSGNGREYADWGIHDFLEIKGIVGYGD
ncbi:aldehyde dehydrogenase family protein [Rhizobium sp. S95]|uniref:Aldehyde dehydrogenase family protein n=1 Tax=Ciceribacter sichuanensis TaxID=2949647 RepID=A0AAJ1F7I2_9HYPH|nr:MULTISPECIES: aldehyde dehydrogenase family protein [unclassified Ciceribacter]MCM2398610.1 aldehyde dehydrogenase family protein [Ciceribacter sp. S95]MCO5957184.1 aldehyde dehydrogenase family protein [Ciceribacter sp. S101]